jgi:hypothetical protein
MTDNSSEGAVAAYVAPFWQIAATNPQSLKAAVALTVMIEFSGCCCPG